MEDNSSDIRRFVQSEVDRLTSKRLFLDGKVAPKLKRKIVETLTKGAQGMFRWVEMSLEALKRIEFLPDFKKTLGQLPSELSGLYDFIHAQIDQTEAYGRDTATQTLRWLLCAQRLMSAEELIAAVYKFDDDISSDSDEDSEFESEQLRPTENDILRLCRNLVVFDPEKRLFRFAHQSVREYLLKQPQYAAVEQHTRAAERCLDVYLNKPLKGSVAQKMKRHNDILKPYADVYWPVHLKHVDDSRYSEYTKEELRFTGQIRGRSLPYVQWILDILKPYPEVYQSVHYRQTKHSQSSELEKKVSKFTGQNQGTSSPYLQWISDIRVKCGENAYNVNERLGLNADDRLGARLNFAISRSDTILTAACAFGISSFLENHELSSRSWNQCQGSLLCFATREGYAKVVQLLLSNGADVNTSSEHYGRPLMQATKNGHSHIVQMLLDQGADMNAPGYELSALQVACGKNHIQIVRMLLDRGADPNAQPRYDGNTLEIACRKGHIQIVQMLLDRGADINAQGVRIGTALQVASHRGYNLIVQMLLDRGANINAQGVQLGTALQAAFYGGHDQIVQTLLDKGADINTQDHFGIALQAASSGGYDQTVKLLLDRGANVNAQGGYNGTALQAASDGGYDDIVEMLLDHEMDTETNASNETWGTALHMASAGGHGRVVRILLDRGADVNAYAPNNKPFHGFPETCGTALHVASAGGYCHVVQMLLDRGADVNAHETLGWTALQMAQELCYDQIVKMILDHGAEKSVGQARGGDQGESDAEAESSSDLVAAETRSGDEV